MKGYSFESVLFTFKDGSTSLLEARDDTRYVAPLLGEDGVLVYGWSDGDKSCMFVAFKKELRSVLLVDERSEG